MGIFQDHMAKWAAEREKYAAVEAMEESANEIIGRTTVHRPSPREPFTDQTIPLPHMVTADIGGIQWWKINVYETNTNRNQLFTYKKVRGTMNVFVVGVRAHSADHSYLVVNGTDWYWVPENIYTTEEQYQQGWRPTEDQKVKFDPFEIAKSFYGEPKEKTVYVFR